MSALLKYVSVILAGKSSANLSIRVQEQDTDVDDDSSFHLRPGPGVAAGKQRLRPLVSRQLRAVLQECRRVRFVRGAQQLSMPPDCLPQPSPVGRLVGIKETNGAVVSSPTVGDDVKMRSGSLRLNGGKLTGFGFAMYGYFPCRFNVYT
jgi:hypothetical protein